MTAAVVLIGFLITVTVPLSFPAGGGPTAVDRAVGDRVHDSLDAHPGIYHALVIPSDAYIVLPLLLLGMVYCALRRDWWGAGFLLIVPELVVAINTWALKPLWDRHLQHYLAYPSGHTVQFVAIATGLLLVAATAWLRITVAVLAAIALAAVAVGMVGLGYHHPTDVVGGTAFAVAAVTASWAAVTPWRTREQHRESRDDPGVAGPAAAEAATGTDQPGP
ncbi:phosphatase PAP2 family protein [Nocardia sp. NPDC052254]|uniref:phosphatase PAP2 family protein n=1 Tax=Nocardia sp. NPDC052254 TaxID=3155681 RepID=UPI0034288F67